MEASERRLTAIVVTLFILGALSVMILGVAWWLGLPPYGGRASGVIIAKNIVTFQSRRTFVQYFVTLRTRDGRMLRVAIPQSLYRAVSNGWMLEKRENVFLVTSPGGAKQTFSTLE